MSKADQAALLQQARIYYAGPLYSITYTTSERSPASKHDYFSEGTYWWPDEKKPNGPFVKKDGQVYPGAFFDHANAVLNLSNAVTCLAVAHRVSGESRFADKAAALLETFFLDPETRMRPHLKYAQGIPGHCAGRCYGIIDTHHFAEVTLAVAWIEEVLPANLVAGVRDWFKRFNRWLVQSAFGIEEKAQPNNHAVYYLVQVAAYARFTGDSPILDACREFFKQTIVPEQIAPDGSMPMEIKRTKSFTYSVFALNGMAILCKLLSTGTDNLFRYAATDGRGVEKALAFLFPYLAGSVRWPYTDISEFGPAELRPVALLFGGAVLDVKEYLQLYESLRASHAGRFELRRDICVKQPALWMSGDRPWTV